MVRNSSEQDVSVQGYLYRVEVLVLDTIKDSFFTSSGHLKIRLRTWTKTKQWPKPVRLPYWNMEPENHTPSITATRNVLLTKLSIYIYIHYPNTDRNSIPYPLRPNQTHHHALLSRQHPDNQTTLHSLLHIINAPPPSSSLSSRGTGDMTFENVSCSLMFIEGRGMEGTDSHSSWAPHRDRIIRARVLRDMSSSAGARR